MKRREFLRGSLAAVAAPLIVPSSVLGREGHVPPSDRIVMGCIGLGGQGTYNMRAFISQPDTEIVALCDVDEGIDGGIVRGQQTQAVNGLRQAVEKAVQTYADLGRTVSEDRFAQYIDYRELLARPDIDAVTICTPDHWHGLISVAAAEAGKDIYCEKPLVNSVAEGRAVVDAVKRYGRVLQTGSHERSNDSVRFAWELVKNGRVGKLREIHVNMPNSDPHHMELRQDRGDHPEMPVPQGFHYDFWLGPAPAAPYTLKRTHFWWRFILDTGGGEMTDRGAHIIDLAQFIHESDDSGPIELRAEGSQVGSKLFDCFIEYAFECTYADGVKIIGTSTGNRGLKLVGSDGWIFIHIHGGRLEASHPDILRQNISAAEIHTERSPGHHRNFLDCVKTRRLPVAHAEIGHRTATICHLLNIAMLTRKPIRWDPVKETSDDPDINRLLARPMRSPWQL